MKNVKRAVSILAALLTLALMAQAQDPSVEGRLLQILRENGVISEAQYAELLKLETEMRRDSDLEARLQTHIDEMVSRVADEAPKSGYRIGRGFNWETPDKKFALAIGGRLQVRFTFEEGDNGNAASFFDEGQPSFNVPRARIWLQGHAFETWWKYNFQFDIAGDTARGPVSVSNAMAGTSTGNFTSQNRLTELKDAYLEFAKWNEFTIRAGHYKVPYSRHQITSSGRLEFVDRTITDGAFAPGRSYGLMFYGKLGGEKSDFFEYYAGAFNGEGENLQNNDDGLMYAGRVAINPFGGVSYSESALGSTEDFRLALGLNAYFHDNDNHNQAGARFDTWSIGADLTLLWKRFFATAEIHYREDEQAGSDREALGWFAQLGYFILPDELEIAIRAANIDFDNSATSTAQREYLLALGYFLSGHNLKFQADFGRVELHNNNQATNLDEWRFRLQAQIIF